MQNIQDICQRDIALRQMPSVAPARTRMGLAAMALTSFLAACAPAIDTTRPGFNFAAAFQNTQKNSTRLLDEKNWWHGLEDNVLNALIEQALVDSPDLAAAQLRAHAAWREIGAVPGLRTVESGASARANSGNLRSEDSVVGAALNLELVFDLGRGREAQRLGAIAQTGIAHAEASAARLLLIGEVANAYLTLRQGQQHLALVDKGLARQRQTLTIARDLLAEGEGTRIETLRSEARLSALQAERIQIAAAIEKDILRLAVLTGVAPGGLDAGLETALRQVRSQPRPRLAPDPAVPADLVRNRPDLRVAEARYDAARAALGSARAALYPSLSLSGIIDVREVRFGSTDRRGSINSLGPTLRLPVLPQRAARAAVDGALLRVEAEYSSWTAAVLNSLLEVETGLIDYRKSTQQEQASARTVALQTQAYTLMKEAVREGGATLAELATIERDLMDLESTQINARFLRAQSFVALNIRLGLGSIP